MIPKPMQINHYVNQHICLLKHYSGDASVALSVMNFRYVSFSARLAKPSTRPAVNIHALCSYL